MATLTKAEEMKLFRKLVEALPDGYVRDLLVEADAYIESDMANDICTGTLTGLLRERARRTDEVAGLTKRVAELQDEARQAEKAVAGYRRELADVKADFAALASRAFQMSK